MKRLDVWEDKNGKVWWFLSRRAYQIRLLAR